MVKKCKIWGGWGSGRQANFLSDKPLTKRRYIAHMLQLPGRYIYLIFIPAPDFYYVYGSDSFS